MLACAEGRVLELEVDANEADFGVGTFDTVVACLVLCSVPDLAGTAAAVYRWLVPGGRFLFVEHVGGVGARGAVQRAAAPLWAATAGGCRPDRDILNALRRAGFAITDCERFELPGRNPLLTRCAGGVARPRPLVLAVPVDGLDEEEEMEG